MQIPYGILRFSSPKITCSQVSNAQCPWTVITWSPVIAFASFREFKRVLPLPNGNWNALVDEWCCHPNPFANRKLLPGVDDCLLGDSFLLLNRDSSCEQTLAEEVKPAGSEDGQDPKVRSDSPLCDNFIKTFQHSTFYSCSNNMNPADLPLCRGVSEIKHPVAEVTSWSLWRCCMSIS